MQLEDGDVQLVLVERTCLVGVERMERVTTEHVCAMPDSKAHLARGNQLGYNSHAISFNLQQIKQMNVQHLRQCCAKMVRALSRSGNARWTLWQTLKGQHYLREKQSWELAQLCR